MAETSPRVCHLTLLNPARHGRIFYKEALSLRDAGFRVTIIGLAGPDEPASAPNGFDTVEGIELITLEPTKRWSWRRLIRPWRILLLAFRQKAAVYQLHTPELLWVGAVLRLLTSASIVYDVHEDYAANFRHYGVYPAWLRPLLVAYVRTTEFCSRAFVAAYVLAEDCYKPFFPASKSVVVANKVAEYSSTDLPISENSTIPTLLYTGTLAPAWGIECAIDLWEALQPHHRCQLIVAGHTTDAEYISKIKQRISSSPYASLAQLIGGTSYVPYDTIRTLQAQCTALLGLYQVNPANAQRIPTKFYEAMAAQKPLLFSENPTWDALNQKLNFGLSINKIDEATVAQVVAALQNRFEGCYAKPISESEYSWQYEAEKLIALYSKLLTTAK